jgi:hypothetical protein
MRVLNEVAKEGGYIMDAGAIMQNDTSIENLRVMTEVTREHGVYGDSAAPTPTAPAQMPASQQDRAKLIGMAGRPQARIKPGVCFPWEDKVKDLPPITGNQELVRKVWEDIESLGNMYIWQLLLSF